MAKHIWTVLCARTLEDPISKTVSLVEILEAMTLSPAPKKPPTGEVAAIQVQLRLVSYWTRSDENVAEEFRIRAGVRMPNGALAVMPDVAFKLTKLNFRQTFNIPSLPYVGVGRYWFYVDGSSDGKKWDRAAEIPFDLRETAPQGGAEESPAKRGQTKPRKRGRALKK